MLCACLVVLVSGCKRFFCTWALSRFLREQRATSLGNPAPQKRSAKILVGSTRLGPARSHSEPCISQTRTKDRLAEAIALESCLSSSSCSIGVTEARELISNPNRLEVMHGAFLERLFASLTLCPPSSRLAPFACSRRWVRPRWKQYLRVFLVNILIKSTAFSRKIKVRPSKMDF